MRSLLAQHGGEEGGVMAEQTPTPKPASVTPPKPSLDDLAGRIKVSHSEIVAVMSGKGLVFKAIEIGKQLKQAKDDLEHGKWLPWLEQCDLKERTAQRYMRLVEHKAKIDDYLAENKSVTVTDLTLNKAYKLTAKEEEKEEEEKEEEQQKEQPTDPVELSDEVDELADELIDKLKELKAENLENAEAAAAELVKSLELLDLLEEKPKMKRAAQGRAAEQHATA